jgi:hypothetical protein
MCRKIEGKEMLTKFCQENLTLRNTGTNEMIIVKWILEKHNV